jgi:hypothetical protein
MIGVLFGNNTELYNASKSTCEALSNDTTSTRYRACMLDCGQMNSTQAGQQVVATTQQFDTDKRTLRKLLSYITYIRGKKTFPLWLSHRRNEMNDKAKAWVNIVRTDEISLRESVDCVGLGKPRTLLVSGTTQ